MVFERGADLAGVVDPLPKVVKDSASCVSPACGGIRDNCCSRATAGARCSLCYCHHLAPDDRTMLSQKKRSVLTHCRLEALRLVWTKSELTSWNQPAGWADMPPRQRRTECPW